MTDINVLGRRNANFVKNFLDNPAINPCLFAKNNFFQLQLFSTTSQTKIKLPLKTFGYLITGAARKPVSRRRKITTFN